MEGKITDIGRENAEQKRKETENPQYRDFITLPNTSTKLSFGTCNWICKKGQVISFW